VLVEADVERVLFEDSRAVGITCRQNGYNDGDALRQLRARKLVVLSAGAFGSPAILERSGIGSPDVLSRAGVQLLQSLPGVGSNYMDHTIALCAFETDLRPGETMDDMVRMDPEVLIKQNSPRLGTNGQDLNIKGRPTDDEVKALGPAFEEFWNSHFVGKPDKPLGWMSMASV
jgi:choline dehydrogenase-like flavoprotein